MRVVFWGFLLVAAMPSHAQPGLDRRAHVVTVSGKGRGAAFKLPQVELENPAVATLINRRLLRRIIAPNVDSPIDTTGTLSQQVRRAAALNCCFSGVHYTVLLNQDGLLSLELTLEYQGAYYYERTDHITFDLNTARILTLADVMADTPKSLAGRMHSAISQRMGEEIAQAAADYGDSATVNDLARRFAWDASSRKVVFARNAQEAGATEPNLTDFALTPHALLLFYRVRLPPGMLNFVPNETYTFPFGKLRPRGMVLRLVQPVMAAPKR